MQWVAVWFLIIVSQPNEKDSYSYSIPVSSQQECVKAAQTRKNNNRYQKFLCEVGTMPVQQDNKSDKLKWQETWYLAVVQEDKVKGNYAYTIPYQNKNQCLQSGKNRKDKNTKNKYICEVGVNPYYSSI